MKLLASLIVLFSLLAASCGSDSESTAVPVTGSDSESAALPAAIDSDGAVQASVDGALAADTSDAPVIDVALNRRWQLVGGTFDGEPFPIVDRWPVTLRFSEGGQFGGIFACNDTGGSYTLEENSLKVDREMLSTLQDCGGDIGISEQTFWQVLQQDLELERVGRQLTMTGEAVDLTFSLMRPISTEALVGITWELDELVEEGESIPFEGDLALTLNADRSFTASTGCRDLTGGYVVRGDVLEFTLGLPGSLPCSGDLARQDLAIRGVLENAKVEVSKGVLTLTGRAPLAGPAPVAHTLSYVAG